MKPLYTLSVLSVMALTSCSLFEPGEYAPIYLQEPSPLDPPGMEAIRAEARAKYVKEGMYADGQELEVQHGKAYLFNRNPDYYEGAKGRMIEAATAKIISCEGLYYFVELDEGSKGFLRETDFVNPVKLVSTMKNDDLLSGIPLLPDESWNNTPPAHGDQTIMMNETGRPVLVVSKKSPKSDEFEARRRELQDSPSENTESLPAPSAEDGGLPTPTAELPEPAGTFGE